MIGEDIAIYREILLKKQILPQTWVIFGPSFAQIVSKYPNLKECPNFLRYTMEIQVVTEYYELYYKISLYQVEITKLLVSYKTTVVSYKITYKVIRIIVFTFSGSIYMKYSTYKI